MTVGCANPDEMYTVDKLIATFERHLDSAVKSGRKSQSTRDWYGYQLSHLSKAVGTASAAKLRITDLDNIEITNAIGRALKCLYAWAAENDIVEKNPFRKLDIPECGQRNRVLERTEMYRLYRAARRPFRLYLFVVAHTIARPGEIRLLRWDQVFLERRSIELTEFKSKEKRRDKLKVRIIPLDRVTVRLLTNLKRKSKSEYVFVSRFGKPHTYNSLRSAMSRARERAALKIKDRERIVCYSLRHTGATEATINGMPLLALARRMGHSKVTTTERYVHLSSDDLVNALDAAEEMKRKPKKDNT
jgi:integrase